jgi:hypothetical protein
MQLNDILKTKEALISEQGVKRIEIVNYEKIIKDVSIVTNIKNSSGLNNKMKLIVPILFIFIFILVGYFKSFYQKQMAKHNT